MHEMETLPIYAILKKLAIYDDILHITYLCSKFNFYLPEHEALIWQVIIDVDVLFHLKTFLVHRAMTYKQFIKNLRKL